LPGEGGAIDASGFRDADGKRYIVYKIDGNSLGLGGSCGNGVAPQKPTPILLAPVQEDGITLTGGPVQLIDRDDADGPLVEAPSLARLVNGQYALFYSSNCYTSTAYDIRWAAAHDIMGPYTKYGPLLATGMAGFTAPGGATIAADGEHMVFHADAAGGKRVMYTTTVFLQGDAVEYS
jgi:beta-xylosidase